MTDWEPSPRFPVYTRANAGEVLPEPASPLGWTLVWEPGVLLGWRDANISFGTFDPDELDEVHPEVVGSFGGYLYIDASTARVFGVRAPGMSPELIDATYFGDHPDVPPYVPRPDDEKPEATARVAETLAWVLTADDLPELRDDRSQGDRARIERPDLARLTDVELVQRARGFVPLVRRLFERHLRVTAAASIGPGALAAVAAAVGDPTLPVRLVAGIGDVDSAAPSWTMWDLGRKVASSPELGATFDEGIDALPARIAALGTAEAGAFLSSFDSFLERFGSRGPNEWDIRSHTWETRPELALAAIDRMRLAPDVESPQARHDRLVIDREQATEGVRAALAGVPEAAAQFEAALRSSHLFLAGRERAKTTIIKVIHEVRMAVWELGRRAHQAGYLASPQQICMLLDAEVDEFVAGAGALTATVADRERQYLELFDLEPPFIVNGVVPPLTRWQRRSASVLPPLAAGGTIQGMAGCPGVAEGRARVVLDPADPSALEPGDVLVAPLTDPAWTPLFVPAAAVVVDVGALVSHAVIVSRELGIPCVVSATAATRTIPDGAWVRVDGTNGTVTVL
ncbi:MAG: phosphoenolpyruvate-utilizing protein [Acidimicrobiales bacterium]|nr:phosphoenolpyruvate-utilizing protein [Acidimicrobiales bacterium]